MFKAIYCIMPSQYLEVSSSCLISWRCAVSAGLTRLEFLKCSGAGLTPAVVFSPFSLRSAGAEAVSETSFRPNAWLTVHPGGSVTVVVAKSEMEPGVATSLPMIVADELEADWQRYAPLSSGSVRALVFAAIAACAAGQPGSGASGTAV